MTTSSGPGEMADAPNLRRVRWGGFRKEAKYEAHRASVPITLVDLDELAALVVEHYERFDTEGRGLLPLVRVYWPAR